MAYVGNLTCGDCGLTFTSQWGPSLSLDEYRCELDHVVLAESATGEVVSVDGLSAGGYTLAELRGLCPRCHTELASGLLPSCPVCGGRDHEVLLGGSLAGP